MSEKRLSHILSKLSSYVSIQRKLNAFYCVFFAIADVKERSISQQPANIDIFLGNGAFIQDINYEQAA